MTDVAAYQANISEKWAEAYQKLAAVIAENIPEGFELSMQYGMPTYFVPLAKYPEGYLERQTEPLPFISLASQKNYLALYHLGVYADQALLNWFETEYAKQVSTKLNMGKSCIRFTNVKTIPYELIGELVSKITVNQWIDRYEEGATK